MPGRRALASYACSQELCDTILVNVEAVFNPHPNIAFNINSRLVGECMAYFQNVFTATI